MAFTKRTVTDRSVQYPHRYQLNTVVGQEGVYDLSPVTGTVADAGTAINKLYLQPIEDTLATIPVFQQAGGTATAITLDVVLTNGYSVTAVIASNNNSSATTINGKPLYKPGTTSAPNLIAGKAVTFWYNSSGDNFFIKASAEGNAVVAEVLAGKIFSNDNDTGLVGTMPNRGAVTFTPDDSGIVYPSGYYTSITVQARPALSGTATTGQVLSGATFYSNTYTKQTGTIASKTAQTFTPSTVTQTIASGQYLSGTQTISGASTLTAANIKHAVSIFGVTGTFSSTASGATAAQIQTGRVAFVNGAQVTGTAPTKTAQTFTPGTTNQTIASGQILTGVQTISGSANLTAANIASGVNIFGVVGQIFQPRVRPQLSGTTLMGTHYCCIQNSTYGIIGGERTTSTYPSIITSPLTDLVTWTYRSPGGTASGWNPRDFAWSGTTLAVTRTYGMSSSSDGLTWTHRYNIPLGAAFSLAFGNNMFVACGSTDGTNAKIWTSPDAVTWTARDIASSPSSSQVQVGFINGTFVIVFGDVSGNKYFTSTNGTSWTARTFPVVGNASIGGGGHESSGNVMVARVGSPRYSTTNGTTWTAITSPINYQLTTRMRSFSGKLYTTFDYTLWSSSDGWNWTEVSIGSIFSGTWNSVIFTPSKFRVHTNSSSIVSI